MTRPTLRLSAVLVFVALAGSFHAATPAEDFTRICNEIAANKEAKDDTQRLHRLFDGQWEYVKLDAPEFSTRKGYPGQNDRWTDFSLEAIQHRKNLLKPVSKAINSIDRSRLSKDDQLNHDIWIRNIALSQEGQRFNALYMPMTQMGGIHTWSPALIAMMPTRTATDYENITARLEGMSTMVDQQITLMREGLKRGLTPPKVPLRTLPSQVEKQITDDPLKSALMRPFTRIPKSFSDEDKERILKRGIEAYEKYAKPSYELLHTFLKDDYVPNCRETIGQSALPDGKAWYAYMVRRITTTDLTPQQIHEIGLSEVKRIRGEMEKIKKQTGFEGDLQEFFEFLRTDKQFFYDTPAQLLAGYRDICKRADPELIRLFRKLPRQPYGIKPVPSYSEQSVTTAYYQPGSINAGRPGYFFANTYALETRPKWEMEALSLHEAVPGHHFQIAIADELEGLPEFRKNDRYTAYVEGWGLYAESLGEEMGFYQDPYSKMGQLTYEMWRAIRLVVDTGMHALGWSRQQSIDYFKANAGKSEHDIIVEVDRYIVWPGQALAYKIGELKIKELRANAEKDLGDKFDLRDFHDELLGAGALPLSILQTRMESWAARVKAKG